MLTFEEIKERMTNQMDTYEVLEVLDIQIDELIDRFDDKVEENRVKLIMELTNEPN